MSDFKKQRQKNILCITWTKRKQQNKTNRIHVGHKRRVTPADAPSGGRDSGQGDTEHLAPYPWAVSVCCNVQQASCVKNIPLKRVVYNAMF